jgi:hypothetical protein
MASISIKYPEIQLIGRSSEEVVSLVFGGGNNKTRRKPLKPILVALVVKPIYY